jgi:hypothetical protein
LNVIFFHSQDVRVLLPSPRDPNRPLAAGGGAKTEEGEEEPEEAYSHLDLGLDLSDALHGIKFGQELPASVNK